MENRQTGIQCFIGLGNPGENYSNTRHNVGMWFIDLLAEQHHANFRAEKKLHGVVTEFSHNHQKILLFKPTTYMNESGRAVSALLKFYKIAPENILIAHDELDFEGGTTRLKKGGGHGGHNGLRDVIVCLSSPEFYRLRIGIGHPGNRDAVVEYVLHKPSLSDKKNILSSLDAAATVVPLLVTGDIQKAFSQLHSAPNAE
ncbi:MAG: aminoacyl-tRNA hydrolase [Gammaproteobacteria bacterium RIFCSPHIGHO2_12_FULL_42_13]|nr:MAG: aminoacyl-tRNA hydrolase [Gammaproteobacteria bacterium RIFCSPHIGHO2_12_FULL_42_13]